MVDNQNVLADCLSEVGMYRFNAHVIHVLHIIPILPILILGQFHSTFCMAFTVALKYIGLGKRS